MSTISNTSSRQKIASQRGSRSTSDIIAYIGPAVTLRNVFNDRARDIIALTENSHVAVRHSSETGLRNPTPTTPAIRREPIPGRQLTVEPENKPARAIAVNLDKITKTNLGFVCGRYQPLVDFFTPHWSDYISNQHFSITFDEQYQLIIQDLGSTLGTSVRYDGEDTGMRRNCQWIIGGADFLKNIKEIVIELPSQIEFQITVMPFDPNNDEFRSKVDRFLQRQAIQAQANGISGSGQLLNETAVPSDAFTPMSDADSVIRRLISSGGFGDVWRATNHSTGEQWIEKKPRKNVSFRFSDTEAELLSKIDHDNIIRIFGFSPSPTPILRLEYVPGGTLSDHLSARKYFTWTESIDIAKQSTSAVAYLHGFRLTITHRDISAANVFVQQRDKNGIHIKLADFGLSKEGSDLKSFGGTPRYVPPEIYLVHKGNEEDRYTKLVDIWSLGVVLAEITWNLPPLRRHTSDYNVSWCEEVASHIEGTVQGIGGPFTTFLQQNMLQLDPLCRKSAQHCHERVKQLRGIGSEIWEPGSSAELWFYDEGEDALSGENVEDCNNQSSNEGGSPLSPPLQEQQLLTDTTNTQCLAHLVPSLEHDQSYSEYFQDVDSAEMGRLSTMGTKGSQ